MDEEKKIIRDLPKNTESATDVAMAKELADSRIEKGREARKDELESKDKRLDEAQDRIARIDQKGSELTQPLPLTSEEKQELDQHLEIFKGKFGKKLSSLVDGINTAADYDCHIQNWSTKTSLVKLESGRRVFVVFNFPASWIHRKLDTILKRLTGKKISKADSKSWKGTFERRTQIPTISNSDPNVIMMDYIPNVNLYDLFSNRAEKDKNGEPLIKNYGECDFAENIDPEGLLQVVEKVIDKTKDMHEHDLHWGELILPNIIIDKKQDVHFCDPETEYDDKVPMAERRARDLLVFIMSSAAAMDRAEKVDHSVTIKRALDRYQLDADTKAELKKIVSKPMTIIQKILFGYTKVNYGLKNQTEYRKIMENIAEYLG